MSSPIVIATPRTTIVIARPRSGRSNLLLLALLLVTVCPRGVVAQDAAAWRDSTARLTREISAVRDSLVSADSTVVELERKNGIALSASSRLRDPAIAGFREFVDQRAHWFGSALPSDAGFRLVVQVSQRRNLFGRFGDAAQWNGSVILTGLPDTLEATRAMRAAAEKELGAQLLTGFSELMFPTLGVPTGKWLGDPPPFHLDQHERRILAMYMVMTSTGKAERGCVDGRIEQCAYALGVRVAPSSDLTDAFQPMVRADLFLTALEIGGPEAWPRIIAARPARAEDALVAASGLGSDSLLARWRNGILALRPTRGPLQSSTALLVFVWAGALLLGALGASRWR